MKRSRHKFHAANHLETELTAAFII